MITRIFDFKSRNAIEYNDIVLPGYAYHTKGHSYTFQLKPKSRFWRFGIRLSKSPEINFYHPDHRYKSPQFFTNSIDIYIGAGDQKDRQWQNENKLQLCQYNIPDTDHLLGELLTYKNRGNVSWNMYFDEGENSINITCTTAENYQIVKSIKFPADFNYFKIFAWADSTSYHVNSEIIAVPLRLMSEDAETISGIKVGNVLFRHGSMFDQETLNNSDCILLPASSQGTASSNFLKRATEMGIPYPPQNAPGTVLLYEVIRFTRFFAGYAYSVNNESSSIEIINKICNMLFYHTFPDKSINLINIPLLGCGAGQLEKLVVAGLYDEVFNTKPTNRKYTVSIPDPDAFRDIVEYFTGRFLTAKQPAATEKPSSIIELETYLNTELSHSSFKTEKGVIVELQISSAFIEIKRLHDLFPKLKSLILDKPKIQDFNSLQLFKELTSLAISDSESAVDIPSSLIKRLKSLDLKYCIPKKIDIKLGKKLENLNLSGCRLKHILPIAGLTKLKTLNLSNNSLFSIDDISKLINLKKLFISNNAIQSIASLSNLKKLEILDISSNNISEVNILNTLPALSNLKAEKNPFLEKDKISLPDNENHLPAIRNMLLRKAEKEKIEIRLPVKVLLLGNHASGKSSILSFLQSGELSEHMDSTHIINIEKFPKNSDGLPEAIFYDFGGQDYYHGIYRAFLSSGSVYLLLWSHAYNLNKSRPDIHKIITQDFSLSYWLSQKQYLENEKYEGANDPLILIQTFADSHPKENYTNIQLSKNISHDFYLSLKKKKDGSSLKKVNDYALDYFRAYFQEILTQKRSVQREPKWYINFLLFILKENQKANHQAKTVKSILKHYQRTELDKEELIKLDLDQFHKQGLILYYPSQLPDILWLNPAALAKYVHDRILNQNEIGKYRGCVPYAEFLAFDQDIIKLLLLQKVIYLHEHGKEGFAEYIVPNFLPFAEEDQSYFDFMTFDLTNPSFILKFCNFIPFGLINQLICLFGGQKDKKLFWRDQLLFTFENKAKVLIKLNFDHLQISVYVSFLKNTGERDKSNILKFLFYGIMGQYWDMPILDYSTFIRYMSNEIKASDFPENSELFHQLNSCERLYEREQCRPLDMHISLDGEFFILYTELCEQNSSVMIRARKMDDNHTLSESYRTIPIFPFQTFTKNKLRKPFTTVISYSKKDLELVDKFRSYLIPLADDGLVENPWYCTMLEAGSDWNEEITKKFAEADIIFFMISANLMATKYVKEVEIKNAIDRWRNGDKKLRIIPILMEPYQFTRAGDYNLGQFTAFPYTLKAVTEFSNQNLAWHSVTLGLRAMIERSWYPGIHDNEISAELLSIYERIVEKQV